MAFRKRNVALSRAPAGEDALNAPSSPIIAQPAPTPPGVRPSPIDGRPTTSTGTPSLDGILAGHAGLALGHSILIGESGTTDYAGALLRFYAAEGVVQGHKVHVVGMGEVWGRELPGISEDKSDKRKEGKERAEKMKIAWRYEGLGQFESARGASCTYILRMQNHVSNNFDKVRNRLPQCAKDSESKRWCGRRTDGLLPYLRPCQTSHTACRVGDQLRANISTDGRFCVTLPFDSAEYTAATRVDTIAHDPSRCNTGSSLTSAVPSLVSPPDFHTPISPCSTRATPTISTTSDCHCHASIDLVSKIFRPRPLDGDPLRRCP
jgi:hypothetical protein